MHVARYDIRDRRKVWETFVCQGIGEYGGEMALSGGVLVYLTNRGIVAGIDGHTGTVEWVFRYPQDQYWLRLVDSGVYKLSGPGPDWGYPFREKTYVAPDQTYHWEVVKTIPQDAGLGSTARFRIELRLYDYDGGEQLDRKVEKLNFNIVE